MGATRSGLPCPRRCGMVSSARSRDRDAARTGRGCRALLRAHRLHGAVAFRAAAVGAAARSRHRPPRVALPGAGVLRARAGDSRRPARPRPLERAGRRVDDRRHGAGRRAPAAPSRRRARPSARVVDGRHGGAAVRARLPVRDRVAGAGRYDLRHAGRRQALAREALQFIETHSMARGRQDAHHDRVHRRRRSGHARPSDRDGGVERQGRATSARRAPPSALRCAAGWKRSTRRRWSSSATATEPFRIPWMEEPAAHIRDARIVRIAGAGHISNMERPQEFNRAVLEFLGV